MIWVEVPYRNIRIVLNGMARINPEVSDWIKTYCQPIDSNRARFQFAGHELGLEDPFRHARVAFLSKEEAMMFKLTWGGK